MHIPNNSLARLALLATSLPLLVNSALAEQSPRYTTLTKGVVCNEKSDLGRFLSSENVAMSLIISGRCMGIDGSGRPVQGEILESEPFEQGQMHRFEFTGPAGGGIVWVVGFFDPPITNSSSPQGHDAPYNSTSEEDSISQNTMTFKSSDYIVRIRPTGTGSYEYSSWSTESNTNTPPDMVISHGSKIRDGSGGNYYYSFANGGYTYNVHVVLLGNSSSPDGWLEVLNEGSRIVRQALRTVQ